MTTRTVPTYVREHLIVHPFAPAAEIAAALGLTEKTIRNHRGDLRALGVIPRRHRHVDLDDVAEHLCDGAATAPVAALYHLSPAALARRMRKAGMPVTDLRRTHIYSGTDTLRMLGYSPNAAGWRCLRAWQAAGLRAERSRYRGDPWRITALALMEFLERPDCPIDPACIADPDWCQYAEAARAGHLREPLPLDVARQAPPTPLCADGCGAPVSRDGRRCRSCAGRGNRNATRGKA